MPEGTTLADARVAKAEAKRQFAGNADVVGVGLTKTKRGYAVRINLKNPPASAVPTRVRGVPIVFEVVGSNAKR